MHRRIRGVDLIAVGARYHGSYRSRYVIFRSTHHSAVNEEDIYKQAFDGLALEIEVKFDSGKVLNMTSLLQRYRTKLENHRCKSAYTYRAEKLKRRIQHTFQERIVFQKQQHPSKPELVYSRGITVSAVLNKLVKDGRSDVYRQPTGAEPVQPDDEHIALLHAATIIRLSIIEKCQSVRIQPIETDALTAQLRSISHSRYIVQILAPPYFK